MSGDPQTVFDLVSGQFTDAQGFADNAKDQATQALADMVSYLGEWTFDAVTVETDIDRPEISDIPTESFSDPSITTITPTTISPPSPYITPIVPGTYTSPGTTATPPGSYDPYTPQFVDDPTLKLDESEITFEGDYNPVDVVIDTVEPGTAPTSPALTIPPVPSIDSPVEPTAPALAPIPTPATISVEYPEKPSLDNVTIPDAPSIVVDDFTEEIPSFDYEPAIPGIQVEILPYNSELLTLVKAKITAILENGGVTLSDEVAQAIWDNGMNRVEEQLEKSVTDVTTFFSSRGWVIPPGSMSAKIKEAYAARDKAINELNNNIVAKQGELAVNSFHQALQTGASIESQAMQYSLNMINASIEVQKATMEGCIAAYNARVAYYNALMEGYKTKIEAYKSKLTAKIAMSSIYENEVKGVIALTSLQATKIEVYKAEVQAEGLKISMYQSQIEAMKVLASVEQLKIESYKAQIEAYAARINGNVARANLYQAQVVGVEAQAKIYLSQVEAFKAEEQTKALQAETYIKQAEAKIEQNKAAIQIYMGAVEKYKADISAQATKNQGKIEEFRGLSEQAKIKNEFQISLLDADSKAYLASIQAYSANVQADAARIDEEIKSFMATEQAKVQNLQADIAQSDAEVKIYLGQIEGEKARIGAIEATNDANVKAFVGRLESYKSKLAACAEVIRGQASAYDAYAKQAIANGELQLKEASTNLEILLHRNQVLVEASKGIATISAQLAAGAMGATNAAAHVTGASSANYEMKRETPTYAHHYNYTR